jgi:hypothetical protein
MLLLSSFFAYLTTQVQNIIYLQLRLQSGLRLTSYSTCIGDAYKHSSSGIASVSAFNEDADYDKVIARYRSEGSGDATKDMKIVPVNFNKEHKAMLGHCKMIFESDGGRIAINPDRFDKLITALRTAVDNDGTLDKEPTSYNDNFDAFRLA